MKARAAAALLALACATHAAAGAAAPLALRVHAGPDGELPWSGLVLGDVTAGNGAGHMVYGPGPVGFVVALVTHGLMASGAQKAQRQRAQSAADAVLDPYRALLDSWRADALAEAALRQLPPPGLRLLAAGAEPEADAWLLEVTPSYSIAADEATIVLDVALRLRGPNGSARQPHDSAVRVVSTPLPPSPTHSPTPAATAAAPEAAAEPPAAQRHWLADGGSELRRETAAMLAHAVEAARLALVADAANAAEAATPTPPFRSHRYLIGGDERFERGQLVARNCARVLVRTLRGALLSAAVRPDDALACPAPGYRLDAAAR